MAVNLERELKKMTALCSGKELAIGAMEKEIEFLTAEGSRMRHHLENTVKTMKELGTQSGQTISTGWVLNMAESALPDTPSGRQVLPAPVASDKFTKEEIETAVKTTADSRHEQ